MQDLDPSDICKKIFLNPLKRIRVIIRTPTHGRTDNGRTDGWTDGRTDRRTDEQGESSIPPLNFVSGGIIKNKSDADSLPFKLSAMKNYYSLNENIKSVIQQKYTWRCHLWTAYHPVQVWKGLLMQVRYCKWLSDWWLSGKLWYLQHNFVGDTIIHHKASAMM